DYGPFGFVEQYEPLWSPFTSDAERKFGFERQPVAAQAVVEDEYPQLLRAELGAMHAAKLGLATWDQASRRRAARSRALAEAMAEREGEWAAWLKAYASRIAAEGAARPIASPIGTDKGRQPERSWRVEQPE
ncbi:hypothetical protein EMIHUDRAFT_251786, partial [Emiliania huxleyi CCMP1516]|uniref:Selenoprotein O n=2 Tax=Emiliania huxleyi TaxID=2903 RepID=A0A0D3KRY6_EMIH1